MMTADNRNLIIPRGVRPDYLFLIVSLKKKELHSRANAALSLLLSDTQLKKKSGFFYIPRMNNLGISITLEET